MERRQGFGGYAGVRSDCGLGAGPEVDGDVLRHCRMATDAEYEDPTRIQPILRGDLGIAHNGVMRCFDTVAQSDTATFLDTLVSRSGDLSARFLAALGDVSEDPRYAIALTDWNQVLLARRGLPLWTDRKRWCSLPFRGATMVPEDELVILEER